MPSSSTRKRESTTTASSSSRSTSKRKAEPSSSRASSEKPTSSSIVHHAAATPDSILDTTQGELVLFKALTRHRPVGIDKHLHMIGLLTAVNRALQQIDPDSLRPLPSRLLSPTDGGEAEDLTTTAGRGSHQKRDSKGKGRAKASAKEESAGIRVEGEEGLLKDAVGNGRELRLEVGSEEMWIKLRSMWDLDRLDELNGSSSPSSLALSADDSDSSETGRRPEFYLPYSPTFNQLTDTRRLHSPNSLSPSSSSSISPSRKGSNPHNPLKRGAPGDSSDSSLTGDEDEDEEEMEDREDAPREEVEEADVEEEEEEEEAKPAARPRKRRK